jgi:protein TonB
MSYALESPRISSHGFGAVVVAHVLVVATLLQMQVINLPAPLAVISVALLPSSPVVDPAPLKPEIIPPKPKPVMSQQQPVHTPQLAAPAESPATTPAAVPPVPTLAVPATTVSEPVATTPRFDADYLDNPKPPYPPISRRMGEEGKVVLRVKVDASGQAIDVHLHAGSGSDRLDNAALTTVRRWKFVPARLGNAAVAATVLVPIVFSLKD